MSYKAASDTLNKNKGYAMSLTLLEGNEAVAWGAYHAGCRFFAGYPITPATTILSTMMKILPPNGGYCIQGEDEIASIGFCLGASMAGLKVMTATSGPGISLYSENISFAIGSEIPIVIVDVQRLGPSTGYATKAADGDIEFLRWGNSGGLPVIVLAPTDVADCYILTAHAVNLAEKYRCPVFIASNKEIGMARESLDLESLDLPAVIHRRPPSEDVPYLPFAAGSGGVPDFTPIGAEIVSRQTSSMHGPDGYLTVDPEVIAVSQERLYKKLIQAVDSFTFYDLQEEAGAQVLIITYGITARAAQAAAASLRDCGSPVSVLTLKTLWPIPVDLIKNIAASYQQVVVVEMNLGQYIHDIRGIITDRPVRYFGQMDGNLITPAQIEEFIAHV
jgi:2-oxoglutarate ferredoxin oxidoreductase subunit alpha